MSRYREAILDLSPAAYWRLGEHSGTVAAAEIGLVGTYVNTPTLGVASLLTDDANTAVTLAAASTQRVTTAAPVTTAVDNYALIAWIKPNTVLGASRAVIYNGVGGGGGTGCGLFISTNGRLWGYAEGGVGNLTVEASGSPVVIGTTYHVAMVRRSGTTYIYRNGVLVQTGNTSTPLTPTTQTSIGAAGAFYPFDGTIDEPVVVATAPTADQIAHLYAVGSNVEWDVEPVSLMRPMQDGHSVYLRWKPVPDATLYNVWVAVDGVWTLADRVLANEAQADGTFRWIRNEVGPIAVRVSADNALGAESDYSTEYRLNLRGAGAEANSPQRRRQDY